MTRDADARGAALDAFQRVVASGRGIDLAVDVAVVRYRAYCSEATENEVRMALAEGLAKARLAVRGLLACKGKAS
jgi:hypothetical protein